MGLMAIIPLSVRKVHVQVEALRESGRSTSEFTIVGVAQNLMSILPHHITDVSWTIRGKGNIQILNGLGRKAGFETLHQ